MRFFTKRSLFTLLGFSGLALVFAHAVLRAEPGPEDIFREYAWRGPWVNSSGWQRVTDPQATSSGARAFLPNPVNTIHLDDLEGAIGAEVYLEHWGGHAGTSNKRLRLNRGPWIPIPEPSGIPGDAGRHEDPECYQYFTYPTIPLPLEALRQGDNTFEFTCDGQICFDYGWGQWGVYGVTFRIYYDASRPHPAGRITAPLAGASIGDSVSLEFATTDPDRTIERVDFIGKYEDFDHEGNGIYRQWHYIYRYGEIQRHLGTAFSAPFTITWETDWVPDQDTPIQLMARVRDTEGVCYMTPTVDHIVLERPGRPVELYKPYAVPPRWQTRSNSPRHTARVFVGHDLQKATAARLVLSTWSGGHARAIGINDSLVVPRVGQAHRYSFDQLPLSIDLIRPGLNTVFTRATTTHHGIEVLWPGIALMVQYEGAILPESSPSGDAVLFGDELAPSWQLENRTKPAMSLDGKLEISSRDLVYSGEKALAIEAERGWQLDFSTDAPIYLAGYEALRFAFHPNDAFTRPRTRFQLELNDHAISLLGNPEDGMQVDMDRREWQVVRFPLESFSARYPYIESLRLSGNFGGTFAIDDIRLVASSPSTVVVEEQSATWPEALFLAPNYPNPFNASTAIPFSLPASGVVQLAVYNLAGQKVAQLIHGHRPAGTYTIHWDGRDQSGRALASGVYLYRLQVGARVETRKLVLLR